MAMNNILLVDNSDGTIFGIIRTDNSKAEIESIFDTVKDRVPSEWQVSDLLDELKEKGIKFSYEKFDTLYI